MYEGPPAIDPVRQKGRIFIVRRHDDAITFECAEIPGQSKRNSGTAFGVRRVSDGILLQFWNVGNARIFDSPKLFWIFDRVRHEGRLWIDLPAVQTVPRTCSTEMGETATILHPAKQQRGPISKERCSGIEYAVDWIWPVFAGQDWIGRMPLKKSIRSVDDQVHR